MPLKEILNKVQEISEKYLTGKPYIVGGLPRDVFMQIPNVKTKDVDLTTNSPEILRLGILVADQLNVTFDLSDDGHLTVFTDEFDLDFSSHFVSENVKKYLEGKFKGLEEAFSRDFTINTLHQDLKTNEILDPTEQGFNDIKNKVIRTPVPAEITLSDDPRRAYRAINLATRYKFTIDPEIKKFILANSELFSPEKIKDKYVAVKVGQSLKNDEALTLNLLKEMNLFKNVPLSGYFKEVLIRNKMLAEYLSDSTIKKEANLLARNWEEYSQQGPAYQSLESWWKNNSQLIPGNYNDSYDDWSRWYMNHYRNDWNFKHKDPTETLNILKNEINNKQYKPIAFSDFTPAEFSTLFDSNQSINFNSELFSIKDGVNIENITPAAKAFIQRVGETARKFKVDRPIITSGWRSIEEQFEIMGKNWLNNGGKKTGRKYLTKLYGKEYGNAMANIFEQYGFGPVAQQLGVSVIQSQPTGSRHIQEPGEAVDFAMTSGIKKVLDYIKSSHEFEMKIVDETKSAGPHYHVTILGQKTKRAKIAERKKLIKNLSATNKN